MAHGWIPFAIAAMLVAPTAHAHSKLDAVPGEFVVKLKHVSDETLPKISKRLGVDVIERVRPDMFLVHTKFLSRLKEHPLVAIAEPNFIYRREKLPNDPDIARTWGLLNNGGVDEMGLRGLPGVDIGASQAWDIVTGSKKVIVAVIDSGIDFKHPDLKNQAWVNEAELNGIAGIDDDGNGFIDDVHGYNFVSNNGDATDDDGHGTHCAGTIGAKGDDGIGITGVNWDVSLMAVKFLDANGEGTMADAIKSIDYARKMGARILNNSWGGRNPSKLLEEAIADTNSAGILFVASAGNEVNDNDTNPRYPSTYAIDNVISVAAIDNRGSLGSFSNYGAKTVHVAAPGVAIVSTVLGGAYESYSGTSMAGPHVAGIAALLLAQDENLKGIDLKKRIIESARPLATLRGRVISGGLADAYYALTQKSPPDDPNDPANLANVFAYQFSTTHPYVEGERIEHTIHVPGAKKLAIRFAKFDTELAYDTLKLFDGAGVFQGTMSGTLTDGSTSPLIEGDTVTIKFRADETVSSYGFDIDAILWE